jgi:hypothetical protein
MNLMTQQNVCKFINDGRGNGDDVHSSEAGYAAVVLTKCMQLSYNSTVACWLRRATNILWVLDLTLDLLDYSPGGINYNTPSITRKSVLLIKYQFFIV